MQRALAPLLKKPLARPRKGTSSPSDDAEWEARTIASRALEHEQTSSTAQPDFSRVRILTTADAAELARAHHARAWAQGNLVGFAAGQYAPDTISGALLLAHELIHILQQQADPGLASLQFDRPGDAAPAVGHFPDRVEMWATLSGLQFSFPGGIFATTSAYLEIMAAILSRLLGPGYEAGLETRVFARLEREILDIGGTMSGTMNRAYTVTPGTPYGTVNMDSQSATGLINLLERPVNENGFGLHIYLSASDRELLVLGNATANLYQQLSSRLPPWYSEFIFARVMAQHGTLLRAYASATAVSGSTTETIESIFTAISGPANVLEAIRNDPAMSQTPSRDTEMDWRTRVSRTDAARGYQLIWPSTSGGSWTSAPPADTEAISNEDAARFLTFIHSQVSFLVEALMPEGRSARVELLARYGRFAGRISRSERVSSETVLNHPTRNPEPAWNSHLTVSPQLLPPSFEAAADASYWFGMHLDYDTPFGFWARYSYLWEYIRLPDPTEETPNPLLMIDAETAEGTAPRFGDVADARLARVRRYNAADLELFPWWLDILNPGIGVTDLVDLNNAMRITGETVRLAVEHTFTSANERQMVFRNPGMYIVRCRALPVLEDDSEVRRRPSVAVMPVIVNLPDAVAIHQVQATLAMRHASAERLLEIEGSLGAVLVTDEADLLAERDFHRLMLATPGERLDLQYAALLSQSRNLTERISLRSEIETLRAAAPSTSRDSRLDLARIRLRELGGNIGTNRADQQQLDRITSQIGQIEDIIAARDARRSALGSTANLPLTATFIGDTGQSVELQLEYQDLGLTEGDSSMRRVYLSDLTTPRSGGDNGTAPAAGTADEGLRNAVENALRSILEGFQGYGRGRVAYEWQGVIHVVPISTSRGALLSEVVENATMVASLAAILAAPFTGGSSLYLLIPIGVVGAVPSAFRLYERYQDSTLHFDDVESLSDIVNFISAFIGLASMRSMIRGVQMGRYLLLMNLGADGSGILLLGAGVVQQLQAIQDRPPSERQARMLEILTQAFVQFGIIGFGSYAASRYGRAPRGTTPDTTTPPRSIEVDPSAPRSEAAPPPGADTTPRPPADTSPTPRTEPPAPVDVPPASTEGPAARTATGPGGRRTPGAHRWAPMEAPPRTGPRADDLPANSPERLLARLSEGVVRRPPPVEAAPATGATPRNEVFRRNITSADAAYAAYNEALARSGGNEVAIWHNPETGEFAISIGSEFEVNTRGLTGRWNAVVHYHHNPTGATIYRLPAPADFNDLLTRYQAAEPRRSVNEFVEYELPGGRRGRTEYGIEPNSDQPYYVRYTTPDGGEQMIRFENDGDYHAYHGGQEVFVEPGTPLYRRMVADIQAYIRRTGHDVETATPEPSSRTMASPTPPRDAPPPESAPAPGTTDPAPIPPGLSESAPVPPPTRPPRRIIVGPRPATPDAPPPPPAARTPEPPTRLAGEREGDFVHRVAEAEGRAYWESLNGPAGRSRENPSRWGRVESTFSNLVAAMANIRTRLNARTRLLGHLLPAVDTAVLTGLVDIFVMRNPALNEMRLALETELRDIATRSNIPLSGMAEWNSLQTFLRGNRDTGGVPSTIGSLRPDRVDFLLDQGRIDILDYTSQPVGGSRFHAFKTRVYIEIMRAIVGPNGPTVRGRDIEMHSDPTTGRIDPTRTREGDWIE